MFDDTLGIGDRCQMPGESRHAVLVTVRREVGRRGIVTALIRVPSPAPVRRCDRFSQARAGSEFEIQLVGGERGRPDWSRPAADVYLERPALEQRQRLTQAENRN